MINKYVIMVFIIGTLTSRDTATNGFFDFEHFFENQINLIQEFHNSLPNFKKNLTIEVLEKIQDNEVLVNIKGIKGESCQATRNENVLTVVTPLEKITVQVTDHTLYVRAIQQEKSESFIKENDNKKQANKTIRSNIVIQTNQEITYPIDIEQQSINYNKTDELLSIAWKFDTRRMGKSVPVTIVEKQISQ